MSSLQQSIAQRRTTDAPNLSCASTLTHSPSLLIHLWRGESWVLPWSHFAGARLSIQDGADRLELSFASQRVTVTGARLSALLDDISHFRLESLRVLPPEYRSIEDDRTAHVAAIEVESLSDPQIRGDILCAPVAPQRSSERGSPG